MNLKSYIVGTRFFDETPVTATDPGYDNETWCIRTGIKVQPGKYTCVAWRGTERWRHEGKRRSRRRTMICAIYLDGKIPSQEEWESMSIIGNIGVDAGLAGFFQNKPNYSNEEWLALCDKIANKSWYITDEGFFTESGYGDGSYYVYGRKNNAGLYTALEIRF